MSEQEFDALLDEARKALESGDKTQIDEALKKLNAATTAGISGYAFEEMAILKALLSSKVSEGVSSNKAVVGFGALALVGVLLVLVGSSSVIE